MKVLLINGSPHPNGCTGTALDEMVKIFVQEKIETETIQVGSKAVRGCIACEKCRELGHCIFDDLVNETAPKFMEADGLVIGSPVYYASANATLNAIIAQSPTAKRLSHWVEVDSSFVHGLSFNQIL